MNSVDKIKKAIEILELEMSQALRRGEKLNIRISVESILNSRMLIAPSIRFDKSISKLRKSLKRIKK